VLNEHSEFEQAKAKQRHPPYSILLVEDDQSLADLEANMLKAHGYQVSTAYSGEQAIAIVKEHQHLFPDLVVLDLELTGNVSGWEVLQTLRTYGAIPVLITTSTVADVRPYLQAYGESKLTLSHLPKPYPMQTFLKRIQRILTISSS
jgi:CheY-like chemotaxis protein